MSAILHLFFFLPLGMGLQCCLLSNVFTSHPLYQQEYRKLSLMSVDYYRQFKMYISTKFMLAEVLLNVQVVSESIFVVHHLPLKYWQDSRVNTSFNFKLKHGTFVHRRNVLEHKPSQCFGRLRHTKNVLTNHSISLASFPTHPPHHSFPIIQGSSYSLLH